MKTLCYCLALAMSSAPLMTAQDTAAPNTLDEAFAALDKLMSPDARSAFMHKREEQATSELHFSLGIYIRNSWFRHGHSDLPDQLHHLGAHSLDDMSAIILISYWRQLNGKPIKPEEQGSCYERWWKEQMRLINEAKTQGRTSYSIPAFTCP